MKIKLAIMGGILLIGAILFMPQTLDLFPNAPEVFDSAKKDISGIQKEVLDSIDNSINSANGQIDNIKESSKDFLSTQEFLKL